MPKIEHFLWLFAYHLMFEAGQGSVKCSPFTVFIVQSHFHLPILFCLIGLVTLCGRFKWNGRGTSGRISDLLLVIKWIFLFLYNKSWLMFVLQYVLDTYGDAHWTVSTPALFLFVAHRFPEIFNWKMNVFFLVLEPKNFANPWNGNAMNFSTWFSYKFRMWTNQQMDVCFVYVVTIFSSLHSRCLFSFCSY